MKAFGWSAKRRRFVYLDSRRAVPARTIQKLRDDFIDGQKKWSGTFADMLASKDAHCERVERLAF